MPKLCVFNIEFTKLISYYFLNMAPRTLELVCVVCSGASISPPVCRTVHQVEDTVIRPLQVLLSHLLCRERKILCSMNEERENSPNPLSS